MRLGVQVQLSMDVSHGRRATSLPFRQSRQHKAAQLYRPGRPVDALLSPVRLHAAPRTADGAAALSATAGSFSTLSHAVGDGRVAGGSHKSSDKGAASPPASVLPPLSLQRLRQPKTAPEAVEAPVPKAVGGPSVSVVPVEFPDDGSGPLPSSAPSSGGSIMPHPMSVQHRLQCQKPHKHLAVGQARRAERGTASSAPTAATVATPATPETHTTGVTAFGPKLSRSPSPERTAPHNQQRSAATPPVSFGLHMLSGWDTESAAPSHRSVHRVVPHASPPPQSPPPASAPPSAIEVLMSTLSSTASAASPEGRRARSRTGTRRSAQRHKQVTTPGASAASVPAASPASSSAVASPLMPQLSPMKLRARPSPHHRPASLAKEWVPETVPLVRPPPRAAAGRRRPKQ